MSSHPRPARWARAVPFATAAEVGRAVEAAKAAFPAWAATTPLARARIMFRFKSLLEQHADELVAAISREHGKVLSDAAGELARGIDIVEYACGAPQLLKSEFTENVSAGIDAYTIRQPLGVVAGITPFNFPRWFRCGCFRWRSSAATRSC
jgi:malonate-semialdehyde dehydrogenase (acetylating)/methylmalonate-semialdehyde dehydrogenase